MPKLLVIIGFGPGISTAVAEKFGAEGFSVALVGRSEDRLAAGVKALTEKGIRSVGFAADASNPDSLRNAISSARAALGTVTVVQWNASSGHELTDPLTASPALLRGIFDVGVLGLLTAVQQTLADLKATRGAVLITNGALADITPETDRFAVSMKLAGVALANAAKHKLVGLLAEQLRGDGIYVGEIIVAGMVKSSAWDKGAATVDGATVADKFWSLFNARTEVRARVG